MLRFEYGKEYTLKAEYARKRTILIRAFYFGKSNNFHVFFRQNGSSIEKYVYLDFRTSNERDNERISAVFEGKINDEEVKQYIKSAIERFKPNK